MAVAPCWMVGVGPNVALEWDAQFDQSEMEALAVSKPSLEKELAHWYWESRSLLAAPDLRQHQ